MITKNVIYTCMLVTIFSGHFTLTAATWKIFFYMDASDDLTDMAFKNITDMMRGNPNNSVEVMIQLHAYDSTALRYQIINSHLVFIQEALLSGDAKQDFIDAASWAFTDNSADHTMLIFSNHGWGALDPRWNPETEKWEAAEMELSNSSTSVCAVPSVLKTMQQKLHERHRGFMFNSASRTYLTNQAMAEGLAYVKDFILHGNTIDIIAFDTCMGSMLEVATCVAPYADYLVGVQSCALRDGFDYQGFVSALNQGAGPRTTAKALVRAFDQYYISHDDQGIYTFAALDLACVNAVNRALDHAVLYLLQNPDYIPLLKIARDQSPRFCLWPIYTDLVAFCNRVEAQLAALPSSADDRDDCIMAIHNFYNEIDDMVIARCAGSSTQGQAHGFSIYLPHQIIDDSYRVSLFAHQSQWINLLQAIC